MECLKSGFVSIDDQAFIIDYHFDETKDDEVPEYQCPLCENDDEDLIIDSEE